MKKLVITFISSLLLFSCSTDDNSSVPNQKGQLVMEVNTKETYVYKPVYFIVKDSRGNYSTHLAKITPIANNDQTVAINGRYKPSKPGEFTFVAKAKIDGVTYKDSAPITIKVKEPTNKIFSINGTSYPVEQASLKIKRLRNKLPNGKEEIQDLIYSKGDDYFYNEYELLVSGGSPYPSNTKVTFLVRNETVKSENGQVISYDKRVLPNQVETTIIKQIITDESNGPTTVNDIYTYPNNNLEFYYLDPIKEGLPTQVLTKSYFGLKFDSTIIDYVGELTFGELIIDN